MSAVWEVGPEAAAARELREETGLALLRVERVFGRSYGSVGLSCESSLVLVCTADDAQPFCGECNPAEEIAPVWVRRVFCYAAADGGNFSFTRYCGAFAPCVCAIVAGAGQGGTQPVPPKRLARKSSRASAGSLFFTERSRKRNKQAACSLLFTSAGENQKDRANVRSFICASVFCFRKA